MRPLCVLLLLSVVCTELVLNTEAFVFRVRIRVGKRNQKRDVQNELPGAKAKVALDQLCSGADVGSTVSLADIQDAFDQADSDDNGVLDAQELKVFASIVALAEACRGSQVIPQ